MSSKTITVVFTVVFNLIILLIPAVAQQQQNFSLNSYLRARKTLDAGIAALGGQRAMQAAGNFSLKMHGRSFQIFQNSAPEAPYEGWASDRTLIVDSKRNYFYGETKLQKPNSDYVWWTRFLIKNNEGYELIMHKRWAVPTQNPSLSDYQDWMQFLPQNVLAEAARNTSNLRRLGNEIFQGRKQDVITFSTSGGRQTALYFDSQTHLLTKYEYLYTRNTLGDAVNEVIFTGYRDVGEIKVPKGRITYTSGILTSEVEYLEPKFDIQPAESLFDVPSNFTKLDIEEPKTFVNKLAENVYLVQNLSEGFNVFFVDFNDFILVAEAPETNVRSGISDQAVKMIKETIPNKPIKYLVLTHHHGDHAGGARAFMAEGATIITTPGNKSFLERLSSLRFSMSPDALSLNPRPLSMEILEDKKRIISDKIHAVEIYRVGFHTKEMLLIYLPKEKILFQSDSFNPVIPGAGPIYRDAPYHGVDVVNTRSLLKFIQEQGLIVEKIAGSHGRIGTMDELIKLARENNSVN